MYLFSIFVIIRRIALSLHYTLIIIIILKLIKNLISFTSFHFTTSLPFQFQNQIWNVRLKKWRNFASCISSATWSYDV